MAWQCMKETSASILLSEGIIPETEVEYILEYGPKVFFSEPAHWLVWMFCHTGLQFYWSVLFGNKESRECRGAIIFGEIVCWN